MFSPRDPPHEHGLSPEQRDPEKGGSGDAQEHDYGDDPDEVEDFEDFEEQHESANVGQEAHNEHQPRRGVPLTFTGTMSSASMVNFSRPSLPRCLVKTKDILFGSHSRDNEEVLPNYRRTPIISGSLIPFSILLEIPGLTEPWYVRTYNHQTVETRKNPPLVVVSISISMALAVLANAALIYRFLDRHVKRNTIICIVALTLHDILNIVTVLTFGVQHRGNDGFTNSEAFWMTICSTIVSTITNMTLIWDFLRTPNFAKAGSGITHKQRSLVIITMIFLTYIALGALISSLMMNLTFINGLFFTIVTTLTIGFGDIVPITPAQRFVVCFYAVFGIIILSAGIRVTSEAVLEGLQVGYRRRIQDYKRRRRARKRERELVRRWRAAVEERLVERELDVWTADNPASSSHYKVRPATLRRGASFTPQAMYLNTEALPRHELEAAAREAGVPSDKFIGRKFGRRARQTRVPHHHHDPDSQQPPSSQQQQQQSKEGERPARVPLEFSWTIDDGGTQEKTGRWGSEWWDRARQALRLANDGTSYPQEDPNGGMTYQEMVKTLEREERRSLYVKLGLSWTLFFVFWTIGSLIFSKTEGWPYGDAMYFCFIAFTTIGYGDLAPETAIGRSIFIFWALFGVGTMTILFAVVNDAFSTKYHSVTHDKRFDRAVRRYRQGQEIAVMNNKKDETCNQKSRSRIVPALKANLARISSREPAPSSSAPKPTLTLEEAEALVRSRIEPLPAMMLREVLRLRDHTRYFLMTNGHADVFDIQTDTVGESGPLPKEHAVHEDLKQLLDEIAEEEGLEEHLKQEVWGDSHARRTLFLLSLEKGARKMTEAAELALETLTERNELLSKEGGGIEVEVFEVPAGPSG
jgi:voltage-gated potassium channel Kch